MIRACLFVALVLSGCKGLDDLSQPQGARHRALDELNYPGYVDVGIGFGVAFNTRSGGPNDARGTLASLKAYPAGRWYSTPKSKSAKALTEASAELVRTAEAEKRAAEKKKPIQRVLEEAVPGETPPPEENPGEGESLPLADYVDQLIAARDEVLKDSEYYVVADRTRWFHRLSVFYGATVGEMTGGGVESIAHVIGVGYDFAPQLALLLGFAFYDVDEGGTIGTDGSLFLGVSVNLLAYKLLFQQ